MTRTSGTVVMPVVPDSCDNPRTPPVHVALCVDSDALDRFSGVLRHLVVGLVDQAVHPRLLSSDPRIESLSLGPVGALVHERARWPVARRRLGRLMDMLSPVPPTIAHAVSSGAYTVAQEIADTFDSDLVLGVTSLADCEALSRLDHGRVARFLAMSEPLATVLVEQLRVRAENIVLIRPGVLAREHVACFALPDRVPTLLCTSALDRHGGVESLIEAVDVLRKRGHDLMLFLLGRGRREDALRRLVRQRQLSSDVTVARPSGDLTNVLHDADIFVLPSEDPTLTADSFEAMGAGVAVVAYPSTVCDHLRADETAVICERPTVDALVAAIEELLRDRGAAQKIATRGMEYVRAHHAVSNEAKCLADTYRELALARVTIPIKE